MEKFMKYANFFYTAVGIEPYKKDLLEHKKSLTSQIVFWANVINLTLVAIGESIYFRSAYSSGKLLEAVTVLSYIGFIIVGMSKMCFIWWKKAAMNGMVRELEEIYPRGKMQEQRYKLEKYLRSCSRISFTYSLLYSLLIWTFNLFSIMQFLVYEKWLNIREVGKTLPYFMYIPWKWEDNWTYYLVLFSQNFAGYTAAAGQISSDLLLSSVATQVVMHFDYLSESMETHELTGDCEKDSVFLTNTVRYHERILRLSDVMNEIFGIPLLLNFMVSSFVICFVGFQMTVGVSPDMITKLFLFLFSSMSQVYLICHYGQLVADASYGLSVAAYSQNWNHADIRYKRALVLIIARAQKLTYLKATIFLDISRSTMTDLLQISYKFFALLRTMYVQ
ncbi:LOW QUALITY PROTEIN: odorant receptor 85b-like [Drosophila rhopaloa]|uniref:Odorant receptor n=1 Tax=Drosophila rhopaloa TaxID=1041015 RepID=A0ABM5I6Y0_DRORH|nr:LOW QUALITY PROTEIN: odorant receptor 85b-like [Drosophila rhopaloa]